MRIGSAPLLLQIFQFLKHRIDRATPIDLGWRLCYPKESLSDLAPLEKKIGWGEIVMLEQGCIYYKLVNFFPQPGPTRVNFFPHLLFSFSMLHAHSDTFFGLKLVHSALKALTKS